MFSPVIPVTPVESADGWGTSTPAIVDLGGPWVPGLISAAAQQQVNIADILREFVPEVRGCQVAGPQMLRISLANDVMATVDLVQRCNEAADWAWKYQYLPAGSMSLSHTVPYYIEAAGDTAGTIAGGVEGVGRGIISPWMLLVAVVVIFSAGKK